MPPTPYKEPTLEYLESLIEAHWRRHEQAMVRRLEASGKLREHVRMMAADTQQMAEGLKHQGLRPPEAWDMAQRELIFGQGT